MRKLNNKILGNKFAFKHGHAIKGKESPTYRTWGQMLSRCKNKNHKDYKWYGGRGIKVCSRWAVFENFLEDMGERLIGTTIDRINNNKNYYKGNCRWATQKIQHRNKRNNRLITFDGITKCLYGWAEHYDMSPQTLHSRLNNYGWTIKDALTTSVKERKNGWKRKQKCQTLKIL